MSEQPFTCVLGKDYHIINNNVDDMTYFLQDGNDVVLLINLLNRLVEENEWLKNEFRKEKSLREYSDSMYGADLIVNIRFSNGRWKADVSVIDDE